MIFLYALIPSFIGHLENILQKRSRQDPEEAGSFAYPDPGGEDDEDPVNDHEDGEEPQQNEPEPDEDVDLLIY